MANQLSMAEIQTILTLHKTGHSYRRIAALLGVNRETVAKYVKQVASEKQPNAPTGSPDGERSPDVPPTACSLGQASACEPHRELILTKLEHGLSAQRIWQDLVDEHD